MYVYIYIPSTKKYYICTYIHTRPQLSFFLQQIHFQPAAVFPRSWLIPTCSKAQVPEMNHHDHFLTLNYPCDLEDSFSSKKLPNAPMRNRSPPKNHFARFFFGRFYFRKFLGPTTYHLVAFGEGFPPPRSLEFLFPRNAKVRSHASKSCP